MEAASHAFLRGYSVQPDITAVFTKVVARPKEKANAIARLAFSHLFWLFILESWNSSNIVVLYQWFFETSNLALLCDHPMFSFFVRKSRLWD